MADFANPYGKGPRKKGGLSGLPSPIKGGSGTSLPKRKKNKLSKRTSKPKGIGLGVLGKGKI